MKTIKDQEYFMGLALKEAKKAKALLEVPVGAVIVKDGQVISKGYNQKETGKTALGHAEISAINKACKKLSSWRLSGCEMYVTLEPCVMCAGAIMHARIDAVYIGARDEKTGFCGSFFDFFSLRVNHKPRIVFGVREEECEAELKEFFKMLRSRKKPLEKNLDF